jgi:hypothetical protein
MDEFWEHTDQETYELEDQPKKGLAFVGLTVIPSKDMLFIVQGVTQIRRGLDNETSTNNTVLVLVQTDVLDDKSMGSSEGFLNHNRETHKDFGGKIFFGGRTLSSSS